MLGEWLRGAIVDAVGTMMVWPQRLTIELGEPRPEGAEEVLSPDQRAEKEVDPKEGQPMTAERAKKLAAQRKPEYTGQLVCLVKSAANLHGKDKVNKVFVLFFCVLLMGMWERNRICWVNVRLMGMLWCFVAPNMIKRKLSAKI